MTRFSEAFWNTEFCNFQGYEVLRRRMRDGKQMLKDFIDCLRQRAQIQESYGKALVKLSRSCGGRDEIGFSWETFRIQTEAIGVTHMTTAMAILDEAARMLEFMELQRDQRKRSEETVHRAQANLKILHKRTLDCKKASENKYREMEAVMQLCQMETAKATCTPKDAEKFHQKQLKACQASELAEKAYKTSLESLEAARVHWEEQTDVVYNVFQMLEEERIKCIRNSMWVVTNLGSTACVKEDAAWEEIRKKLEMCDVALDIEHFTSIKRTGSIRPPPLEYVDSRELPDNHHQPPVKTKLMRSEENQPQVCLSSLTQNEPEISVNNGIYECIDELSLEEPQRIMLRVICSFQSRNVEELSLEMDEIVQLNFKESDEWWNVKTRNGVDGFFPANYLKPV